MKQDLVLAGLFALLTACGGNSRTHSIPRYEFPQQSIITDLGTGCADDPADAVLDLFSGFDKALLSNYSVTSEEEREVGEAIHQQTGYKFLENATTRKLRRILKKMLPHLERQDVDYQVFLIEDNIVNAWTIPGGYIYVTTGMIDFVENDHELANVIGHEIGHTENRHTAKFIQREKQKQDISNMTGVDVSLFVDLYSFATVAYNQPQEIESDYSGFYLAYKAGYDPEIGLEFWRRMALQENPNFFGKFFRSHPYSETRYQCGKKYLESAKQE